MLYLRFGPVYILKSTPFQVNIVVRKVCGQIGMHLLRLRLGQHVFHHHAASSPDHLCFGFWKPATVGFDVSEGNLGDYCTPHGLGWKFNSINIGQSFSFRSELDSLD